MFRSWVLILSVVGLTCACLSVLPASAQQAHTVVAKNTAENVLEYTQTLQVEAEGLSKFELPLETLSASQRDLSDLRIFSPSGNEVGYRIERTFPQHNSKELTTQDFEVKVDQKKVSVSFVNRMGKINKIALRFSSNQKFTGSLDVWGSEDQIHWKQVKKTDSQVLFSSEDDEVTLDFEKQGAVKEKYIRIDIFSPAIGGIKITPQGISSLSELPAQAVSSIFVEYTTTLAEPKPLPEVDLERFEVGKQTDMTLRLKAANLDFAYLDLKTQDALFKRDIKLFASEYIMGEIRSNELMHTSIQRTKAGEPVIIPFERQLSAAELTLSIDNQDSQPLSLEQIDAFYYPVYIIFSAEEVGTYQVRTGSSQLHSPVYDIQSLEDTDLFQKAKLLTKISSLQKTPGYQGIKLGLDLPGAAIDLSAWPYRKKIEIQTPGLQEVELDIEVLAHSQSDMDNIRDLRIISDQKQYPFLVRHRSLLRALSIEATREKSKTPKESLWKLKLPYATLPFLNLSFSSTNQLFERSFRVYEKIEDHGREYDRELGYGAWHKNEDSKSNSFDLSLNVSPTTDTLYLVTSDGDNAPIELQNFEIHLPVINLIFEAKAQSEYFLYYGNSKAVAPQYDFNLMAPRVMRMERASAGLAEEEVFKKTAFDKDSPAMNWLFWGVLALVTLVLLFILSRLIPEQK